MVIQVHWSVFVQVLLLSVLTGVVNTFFLLVILNKLQETIFINIMTLGGLLSGKKGRTQEDET